MPAAAVQIAEQPALPEEDIGAGVARKPRLLHLRPGQGGPIRVGRVGGRQHRQFAGGSVRKRSTAPGRANCEPPRPSTK